MKTMREQRISILNENTRICNTVKAEGRALTSDEEAKIASNFEEAKRLERQIGIVDEVEAMAPRPDTAPTLANAEAPKVRTFRDTCTGQEVRALKHNERAADFVEFDNGRPTVEEAGNALLTMITGRPLRVDNAATRALSEGLNTGGGLLVNEQLSATVIDLARAKSRVLQAGAMTIDMPTESLRLARLTADPTVSETAENASLSFSDAAFDAITLNAKKVGCVVACSNELLADAPNAGEIVIDSLAQAMAAKIDDLLLNGSSSGTNFTGLLSDERIDETNSVGAVDWDDLINAQYEVRALNGEPNGVILSPKAWKALAQIQEATTNAYKTPPAILDSLAYYDTTRIADSKILVGDFTKALLGVRQAVTIRVSDEAGDSFEKDQTYIRVLMRLDTNITHNHFHRLLGLTYS